MSWVCFWAIQDSLCPCFGALSEIAPEEANLGETDGVVGDGACEVDEMEEHRPGGHGMM